MYVIYHLILHFYYFFSQQNENSLKKKTEMYPVFKVPRLKSNCSALLEVEKCTVTKAAESGKSVVYNIYDIMFLL